MEPTRRQSFDGIASAIHSSLNAPDSVPSNRPPSLTAGNYNDNSDDNQPQVPVSAPRHAESLYRPSLTNMKSHATCNLVITILFDSVPRLIYLYLLLRLPAVYFSRVAAIFEESALTLPEIKQLTLESMFVNKGICHSPQNLGQPSTIPLRFNELNNTWNSFVDSLLRDWNTYNIVSALILSAILTILQIDTAAQDPLIRYTLLFSQICAITSLLLGCLYSIRFDSSMRKTYKAAQWANETQQSRVNIWWNIWVLLAMPAIWLAWSSIFYIIAIMAFVWRTDTSIGSPPAPLSPHVLLTVRILITVVLILGLTSGWLSLVTFRQYGHNMDQAWATRVDSWVNRGGHTNGFPDGTALGRTDLPMSLQPTSPNLDFEDSGHSVISRPSVGNGSRPSVYETQFMDGVENIVRSHSGYANTISSNANLSTVPSPHLSQEFQISQRGNTGQDRHFRPHVDIDIEPPIGEAERPKLNSQENLTMEPDV